MKQALLLFNRGVNMMNRLIEWVLAIQLIIMTILIFWQVFARFVMGTPLTFSEEIARFLMIWLTLLGAAYAYRKGTLISIDLVNELLKGRVKQVLNTIVFTLGAIFSLILIVYGIEMVGNVAIQRAPSTGVSMQFPNLAIPVGGILIFINSIALIIDQYTKKEDAA
ncbi:TRAP transporter small permease [Alteribacillus sp. JSM 102045]|uniref:TRAP transporter small permease n=1 Tax=Alteribacillus sp. JSM 102045 TaxID=1562101 RepID=UPI0035C1B5DC